MKKSEETRRRNLGEERKIKEMLIRRLIQMKIYL
jgi:hypothetical protein